MKKFFSFAAIVAAMSFAACTGSTNANTAEEDSLAFATPEAAVSALTEKVQSGDATAIQEAVEAVQTELQEIIESGDTEKAAAYASRIQAFVNENTEKLQELDINTLTLGDIINAVKAAPTTVENTAEAAADAVEADATAAKNAVEEAAKAQADAAVEAGKAKVNETVEEGKKKTNEAVEDAANKANKAASDAINDAVNKIKL